ncbi:MAG: hypothetical protein PHF29_00805 [Candidatus Riflebacteria bacterium]|nr:hypothetical protein [Candidatus Riflebacteria bacterium]
MKKTFIALLGFFMIFACMPSFSQNIKDEAQILYEEAMNYKQQNNNEKAVETYEKALRADRAVLAFNDDGLVEMLRDSVKTRLEKEPENVKLWETMGFIQAVCYSDNKSAIESYEKVVTLVTDENVKERTRALIDRLRETEEILASYKTEVTSQLRDERLKSWSELEKSEKFAEDQAEKEQRASRLEQAYKDKEELQNVVPQLEEELKELQDAYDKANRLWFALNDELYERRRRRLKDQIAEKEQEVASAKSRLQRAESESASLEALAEKDKAKEEETPFRSYDTPSDNEENHEEPVLNDASYANDAAQAPSNETEEPVANTEDTDDTEDTSAPDLGDLIDNL